MNVREYLNESAIFLRDYITVESAVSYLSKKQEATAQEIAAWFLQTYFYLELMPFRIDLVLGSAEFIYDEMDSRQLVGSSLRKIARDGLSVKAVVSNEDVVGWQIQDLNEKLARVGFVKCEIPIEEFSTAGSQVEDIDIRERDSLLKLVIAMAVGGYGYDPTAKKSSTVSSILEDAERLGLAVSDETVRKYLREAARLLR